MSINPLFVSGSLFYASYIWWITRGSEIRMDTRIFSVVLGCEAFMYLVFYFFDFPIEVRALAVRVSLIVIALSQAIPMHISYRRSLKRESV